MFTGNIFGPQASSGSFPTEPPSPVKIGNTLIVSKQGSAAGAREDVAFHYNSIDEAIAAALDGDIIVIYPGVYDMTGITVNQNLFIYGYEGVTINTDVSAPAFIIGKDVILSVTGEITWNCESRLGILIADSGAKVYFECKKVIGSDEILFLVGDGNYNIHIKEVAELHGIGKLLQVQQDGSGGDVIFNASRVERTNINDLFSSIFYVEGATNVILLGEDWIENSNGRCLYIQSGVVNCYVKKLSNIYTGAQKRIIRSSDGAIFTFGSVVHVESSGIASFANIYSDLEATGVSAGFELSFPHESDASTQPSTPGSIININGSIKTNERNAAYIMGGDGSKVYLNGKITHGERSPVIIGFYDGTDYWINKDLTVYMNGDIYSGAENAITIEANPDPSSAIKLCLNGKAFITDTLKFSVYSSRAANVVVQNFVSNCALDSNITELGSSAIIDSNYF